ncbi:MAG: 16S rRNA (adenine(1518)-N(6)/adenine(1519)-N(6))-dimethyltransferase RsmA [Candidatus Omnitrophica bacterium]|nr:16S rRNA (adenine(1518)-N(6)/adenine(1519)-N(6))-dimethyltransferase RsmA [Candidatus Omnitrophota bacterium]MDD5591809.1 16S rRNA (adenine(1518)-N(6)/adenine(1519)-N(6))-dimethyltransferase RsmA [Candidatus Omnitrophota bacterium]
MYLKPKKRLGQNFLVDKNIQRKIAVSCQLGAGDHVLEIGSGYGDLTRLLGQHCAFIYALEIDPDLSRVLKDSTKDYANIRIINRDILKFNLKNYFKKVKGRIKVVGNIPYYITTPIIEHLLKYRDKIESIFITVQKEFAKRITAKAGSKDYGSFSCYVQYYCAARPLFFIKKNSFFPAPKVDSCFIELEVREEGAVRLKDEKLFFTIIRKAFNQRRKTLRNSLSGIIPVLKLTAFFEKYGINRNIRPEDLTLQDFANLSNIKTCSVLEVE